tara:strand:+ start:1577 stop:2101 length:525 start_codon:yes stop_codon:yes gene_type:complete
MDKKGAVELSMTTIIIIVIGITILSLGLVWIRGVFSDVSTISSGAFDQANSEIDELFAGTDQAVGVSPSQLTLDQKGLDQASLAINNLEGGDIQVSASVEARAMGGEPAEKLVCAFSETLTSELPSRTLPSGRGIGNLYIYVEDKGSDLGTYSCAVTIDMGGSQETVSLLVSIE